MKYKIPFADIDESVTAITITDAASGLVSSQIFILLRDRKYPLDQISWLAIIKIATRSAPCVLAFISSNTVS